MGNNENSPLSSQFCYESKFSLKNKVYFRKCARHLMRLSRKYVSNRQKKSCVSEWNTFLRINIMMKHSTI